MLEELKEEAIVNKVGGRFKLSTLIQKRLIALNKGAKPLVDLRTNDKMAIVIQEILQDKIYLDTSGNVQTRNQTALANLPGGSFGVPAINIPPPSHTSESQEEAEGKTDSATAVSPQPSPPAKAEKASKSSQSPTKKKGKK
jgi:DNA-directed RNA polymerase subunit omega